MRRKIKGESRWKRMRIRLGIRLRMLKLFFIYVPEPEDAKRAEEMLEEIKRKSGLT